MSGFRGLCGWSGHSERASRWGGGDILGGRPGKTCVRWRNKHAAGWLRADSGFLGESAVSPTRVNSIRCEQNKRENMQKITSDEDRNQLDGQLT